MRKYVAKPLGSSPSYIVYMYIYMYRVIKTVLYTTFFLVYLCVCVRFIRYDVIFFAHDLQSSQACPTIGSPLILPRPPSAVPAVHLIHPGFQV